ncbi:MAG: hypothetical protein QXS85_05140 [Acidilobaceae archaeon]
MVEAIVVDNMETVASRWLRVELEEVARVARERGLAVILTGFVSPEVEAVAVKLGYEVERDAGRFNRPDSILLDLWASEKLKPHEARTAKYLIVGGILGDHPPRGRTRLLYDRYCYAARRSLGEQQLSIDGAVKTALRVAEGVPLEEIKMVAPLEVEVARGKLRFTVTLPYAYPLRPDGSPDVSPKLVELLERGLTWEELAYTY